MTTETTTRTEISEAMTPHELQAACKALVARLGKGAYVSAVVADYQYSNGCCAHLNVFDGSPQIFRRHTWPESFAAAYQWLDNRILTRRNNIVKRMALKIIDLTDELGSCTEARLRAADFTHVEIVEFHEAACARAGEMAGNVPFVVVMEPL